MNLQRALICGLLAGLVLNVGEAVLHGVVLAGPTAAAMQALGVDGAGSGAGLALLVGVTFLQGVLAMLLYAAVVPAWPPGARTAIGIGLITWALSALYSAVYLDAGFPGILPRDVVWWPAAWGVVEYPLAVWIASLLYRQR
jgi:hypothetical protein